MRELYVSLRFLLVFSLITGGVYPLFVTLVGQALFRHEAEGSLITHEGRVVGSSLIGQSFSSNHYFWGRLSATSPNPYNALSSSGSNFAPTNPQLLDEVRGRIAQLKTGDASSIEQIPIDLVTSSASGLDPDISVAAAFYQAPRIAEHRHIAQAEVEKLINAHIIERTSGVLGERRVNVLELNLALDALHGSTH